MLFTEGLSTLQTEITPICWGVRFLWGRSETCCRYESKVLGNQNVFFIELLFKVKGGIKGLSPCYGTYSNSSFLFGSLSICVKMN